MGPAQMAFAPEADTDTVWHEAVGRALRGFAGRRTRFEAMMSELYATTIMQD